MWRIATMLTRAIWTGTKTGAKYLWSKAGTSTFGRLINVGTVGWLAFDIAKAVTDDDPVNEVMDDIAFSLATPESIVFALNAPCQDVQAVTLGFRRAGMALLASEISATSFRGIIYTAFADYYHLSNGNSRSIYQPLAALEVLKQFELNYTKAVDKQQAVPWLGETTQSEIQRTINALKLFYENEDAEQVLGLDWLIHLFFVLGTFIDPEPGTAIN